MSITALDPQTALVLIDLQNGIVALPTAEPAAEIVSRAADLAEAFRSHDLPVVLVNVAGVAPGRAEQSMPTGQLPAGWSDLVPELGQQPSDVTVTKRTWGAFHETGLDERLKGLAVTQIVLAGISTSAGVESSGRSAHEHGFNVSFATDAMTDMNPDAHANSITRIFPRIGETGSTADILALLNNRA